ncbi:unnamed protein product, partial [marine sediment metagenome]
SNKTIIVTGNLTNAEGETGTISIGTTSGTGILDVNGNINSSGTLNIDLVSSGIGASEIRVSGTFSPSTLDCSTTSTVLFDGTGTQNIPSFTYHHLTISNSDKTTIGELAINGNLTVANNSLDLGIDFTHVVSGNVTNVGTIYMNTSTLDVDDDFNGTSGTIDFQNTTGKLKYSGTATIIFGALNEANGTIVFDGTDQTIPAESYYYLELTPTSVTTHTLGGNITVAKNLTIGVNDTLDVSASNYNITIGGNFTKNGSFTSYRGTPAVRTAIV